MNPPAPDLLEAAATWALRTETGLSERDEADLEAWLEADPAHRVAYASVLEADHALVRHGADQAMIRMRAAALRARPERKAPQSALAAGIAALAIGLGVAGWWGAPRLGSLGALFSQGQTARYVTVAGERATVQLADGSEVALNGDSAITVDFDRQARRVHLVKGQALFTVAHEPARPFEVLADGRRVTAVGTVFDVLVLPEELRVAMLNGVVRVAHDRSKPEQTLSKGEMMTMRHDGSTTIREVDTDRLSGWRDGVVYFDETPLSEAIEEMNRYARKPIVVADARAASLRVSGTFRVAEADAFASAMADIFPLSIKQSADGRTVLASRRM